MAQEKKIITNEIESIENVPATQEEMSVATTSTTQNETATPVRSPEGRKLKVFKVGDQMQATSNRPGLTRSEIYECVAFNSETYMVDIINDENHRKSYPSSCFRMMKDDFAKMFGIEE